MYAIVRCGGRQEKASVDDVLTVDKIAGEAGSTVTLPAVLVVDDGTVVSDPAELGRYTVTAEILGTVSGPKINMIHYRNKTGYRRRLGHRQKHTQLKITGIAPEGGSPARSRSRAAGSSEDKAAAQTAGASTATEERSQPSGRARSGGGRASTGTKTRGSGERSGGSRGGGSKAPAARSGGGSGTGSSRSGSSRRAGGPASGGKPDATDESASGGQES